MNKRNYITCFRLVYRTLPIIYSFLTYAYSYECNQYKENYDHQTGKFINITFYYTCTITCPHCGSTSTFEYKVNAKTAPQANSAVDKYLKGILKIKG